MRRCSRPGCPVEATWAVGFDPVARVAWLTELDRVAPIVLCAAHADALRLPRGWSGRDERGTAPALWLTGESPPRRPKRRRRRRKPDETLATQADPLPLYDHDPAGHIAGSIYGLQGGADGAATVPSEHADSPLLARAFRSAGLG
jgi:hypothetical protein